MNKIKGKGMNKKKKSKERISKMRCKNLWTELCGKKMLRFQILVLRMKYQDMMEVKMILIMKVNS